VCAAAPAFADAQSHVQAAKKAEKKGEWRKALEEWKAAYAADVNAEYLIGIGDACTHLGDKGEAKKNYEAYLADPLALPANDKKDTGPGLTLPGLDLPGAMPPPLPAAPSKKVASSSPGLDLPPIPATLPPAKGEQPASKKDPAVAARGATPGKAVAVTTPPPAAPRRVPEAA